MSTLRSPRRDAARNRERLLDAAAAAVRAEGRSVPLAAVAARAGVGIGTLYRAFADRAALLHALDLRAYAELTVILDRIEGELPASRMSGSAAIGCYLQRVCAAASRMPPEGEEQQLRADVAVARRAVLRRLDAFVARGRADGTVRAAVTGADVFLFGSLLTRPRAYERDPRRWEARQTAVFLNGIAVSGPVGLPPAEIDTDHDESVPDDDYRGGTSRFGMDCQ